MGSYGVRVTLAPGKYHCERLRPVLPDNDSAHFSRRVPGYADRMDIPIACSLTPAGAQSQLGEWRTLLAAVVTDAQRPAPTTLMLRLRDDPSQLAAVVALAQREKACCPFFGFAIEIAADSLALQVTVPPDAVSLLDSFAQLS